LQLTGAKLTHVTSQASAGSNQASKKQIRLQRPPDPRPVVAPEVAKTGTGNFESELCF
jgi:hypothetical protein